MLATHDNIVSKRDESETEAGNGASIMFGRKVYQISANP